jgi:hypothetical protein
MNELDGRRRALDVQQDDPNFRQRYSQAKAHPSGCEQHVIIM